MDLSRACMAIFSAAFFTPLVFSPIAAWASAAPIDTGPPTMSGMNRFLRQGGKNKLVFDAVSAKRAGYSDRDLKIVSSQIRLMNMLLSEGQAILHPDGSLSLRYYASEGSSRTLARGINRMVIQWYGVFEYWLDSDKARGLISEMKMGRLLPDIIPGWLGPTIDIDSTSLLRGARAAVKPDRGVIVYARAMRAGELNSIWFTSQ